MTIGGAETRSPPCAMASSSPRLQSRCRADHEEAGIQRTRSLSRPRRLALGWLFDLDAQLSNRRDKLKTLDPRHGEKPATHANPAGGGLQNRPGRIQASRDITEGAANIASKPSTQEIRAAQRRSVAQQYRPDHHPALKLTAQPAIAKLVDFSLLYEVQRELAIRK